MAVLRCGQQEAVPTTEGPAGASGQGYERAGALSILVASMLDFTAKSSGIVAPSPQNAPATKLRLDLSDRLPFREGMTDNELIAELFVRVGMTMEDVCAEMVAANANDPDQLALLGIRLKKALGRVTALFAAASELIAYRE